MPFEASILGVTKVPVEGVKVNLVDDTLAPDIEPDVALVNVGYSAVAVVVSLVIVIPEVTVEAIDIEPAPGVILIPVPAVSEALVNVLPVELPINNWPSVYDVCPVPPEATPNVPANVTAPDVAVLGVNPLNDVWNVVTAALDKVPHDGIPLDTVNTCPVVPIGSLAKVFVALAYITSPVVYVANPVPPAVVGNVPLVNDDVDVAYKAPPEVNEVNPVPP